MTPNDKRLFDKLVAQRRQTNNRMKTYMREYRRKLVNKTGRPWSLEKHQETGRKIAEMYDFIVGASVDVGSNRGKTSRIKLDFARVMKALDTLRCDLDSLHCMDNPEHFSPDTYYHNSRRLRKGSA